MFEFFLIIFLQKIGQLFTINSIMDSSLHDCYIMTLLVCWQMTDMIFLSILHWGEIVSRGFFFYLPALLGVVFSFFLVRYLVYVNVWWILVKTYLNLDKNTPSQIFHPDVNVCFLAISLVIVTEIESIELLNSQGNVHQTISTFYST